jgi:glycosyltransferase involved in cell wall biosynthesis
MLRVLHLTLASDAGGLSRYVIDLCSKVRDYGVSSVIAGDRGVWQGHFEQANLEYIHVPLKGGIRGFWQSVQLIKSAFKNRKIDLIHTHYRRATQLGRWVQRALDAPILYTLHLSHIEVSGWRRWFSDFGDHTHCASADAREWLVGDARVPEGRISLIPHGVDVERFSVTTPFQRALARQELGLKEHDVVLSFVGRLDDPKNEGWLLDVDEAAQKLGAGPVKILLMGEGPHEAELKRRVEQEGRLGRVMILGPGDPLTVYRASDLLVLPSAREGFSLVCAEAMSTGVPILRTRTSGTSELVAENQTGRSTPINRESFVAAAVMLASDRELLQRMRPTAAAHIRKHFTFEKQVRSTLELYNRLVMQRS